MKPKNTAIAFIRTLGLELEGETAVEGSSVRAAPGKAPANTPRIGRIMCAVDDIEDVLARLRPHGAELVGEVVQYENK